MRTISPGPTTALLASLVLAHQALAAAPDVTKLYRAIRQIPRWDLYHALQIPEQSANHMYQDPTTGVVVRKITSVAVPPVSLPNPNFAVDYAEGGPFISAESSTGKHTLLIRPTDGSRPWLVDYARGVGTSNWRKFREELDPRFPLMTRHPYPRYSQTSAFSNVIQTPHILYFVDNFNLVTQDMRLYRFNTQTGKLEGDGANIPDDGRPIPGTAGSHSESFTRLEWLQSSRDDEWFVFQWCVIDNTTNDVCVVKKVFAYNRLTDDQRERNCIPDDPKKLFECLDRTGPNNEPDMLLDSSDLNEPHLDRDGNYVILLDGTRDDPEVAGYTGDPDCARGSSGRVFSEREWHLWDLTVPDPVPPVPVSDVCRHNIYAAHTGSVRGFFPNHDGDDTPSPNFYCAPASGAVNNTANYDAANAFHASHRAGQWIQAINDTTQWYWGSNQADGEVRAGAWSAIGPRVNCPGINPDEDVNNRIFVSVSGDCDERRDVLNPGNPEPPHYVQNGVICWTPDYLKRNIGIKAVYQSGAGIPFDDPNRLRYNLTPVSSVCAMTSGTFYYDGVSELLYVWTVSGIAPKSVDNHSRIFMFAPTPVHRGVGVRRLDGTDIRLLCHNYTWNGEYKMATDVWEDEYVDTPLANTSPDGKLVMFTSNMGKRDGRTDVFIAEVPLADGGGGGGGCGAPAGTAGPPICQ